jgi:hypothetical protein
VNPFGANPGSEPLLSLRVLHHTEESMLRSPLLLALPALLLPSILFAQSETVHIYEVSWYRTHPGVEAEHSEIYQHEVSTEVFLVSMGRTRHSMMLMP